MLVGPEKDETHTDWLEMWLSGIGQILSVAESVSINEDAQLCLQFWRSSILTAWIDNNNNFIFYVLILQIGAHGS